jgi:hypothetical protein
MTALLEVVSEKTKYFEGIVEYPRALFVAELSPPSIRASESIARAMYAVPIAFVGVI